MNDELDSIHHFALNVADIEKSLAWYRSSYKCEIVYRDRTQAVLQFANVKLTLVLPNTEPAHLAFEREDADKLGELRERPDGTKSTFLADPTGNVIEILRKSSSTDNA